MLVAWQIAQALKTRYLAAHLPDRFGG